MKILEIRLENVNSLYGSWKIDFTAPEYTDGIFAVTGPTGAGKSTILDALCLALYGRTPRLSTISKSTNEIMSRRRGECSAEVTFQTSEGTYTARWSQHRARRNPDGALAEAKQEVFETASGRVIETRKRDIEGTIDRLTGMNYERFTRSMLLAQGSFAVFLQAHPRERAPILEEITGTEIYSRISEKTYERSREEEGKLARLTEDMEGITFFSDAQEADMQRSITEAGDQEQQLRTKLDTFLQQMQWLQNLDKLHQEIEAVNAQRQALQQQLDAFAPKRELLERSAAAAEIESVYSLLQRLLEQMQGDAEKLAELQKARQDAQQSYEALSKQQEAASQRLTEARQRQKDERALIKQVRTLDAAVRQQQETVTALAKQRNELICELKDCQQEQCELEQNKQDQQSQAVSHAAYLEKHFRDQELEQQLAGIREKLSSLQRMSDELIRTDHELKRLSSLLQEQEDALQPAEEDCRSCKAELDGLTKQRKQHEADLAALLGQGSLKDLRGEREHLYETMHQFRQAESYEQQRACLVEGTPCPLCGSTRHPYVSGTPVLPDETRRRHEQISGVIARSEELEEKIQSCSHLERLQMEKLYAAQEKLGTFSRSADRTLREIETRRESRQTLAQQHQEFIDRLLEELEPYGAAELPLKGIPELINNLEGRLQQWRQSRDAKQEIDAVLKEMQGKIDAGLKTEARLQEKLQPVTEALIRKEKEIASAESQRSDLFGSKDPDAHEEMLQQNCDSADSDYRRKQSACGELQQHIHGMTVQIEDLAGRISQLEAEQSTRVNQWEKALKEAGFRSEDEFLSCRLESGRRKELKEQEQTLDAAWSDLTWKLEDRQQAFKTEQQRRLTDRTYDELNSQQQHTRGQLQEISERMGAMKQQLEDSSRARQQYQLKQHEIEAQRKIFGKWSLLSAMIGSADGKKYRNFAQGLTFEMLISQANSQLSRMTDRYLLIQDAEEPLELNVVDNYQGGEIRTTKNLSGGESFIVSLSLALGLSGISSRRVRVDSLFLDEGFGTLDEDTLDTALETLGGLHHEGKIIGIISHVSVLKERISTQIQVVPVSEGMSILKGPGCSRGG